MANSYFKFKQFVIHQDKCAMKVGTDGVLLGAWADLTQSSRILDVGTGTGVISLMLAQRSVFSTTTIDAIDVDYAAVLQARSNVAESIFAQQIKCHHSSLQDYSKKSKCNYDLIVSNPPYFSSSLHSPDVQRTLARHTDSLSLIDLFSCSALLLSVNGRLSLIYPYQEKENIISIGADFGFLVTRITNVYPMPYIGAKRVLIEFSKEGERLIEDNLILEKSRYVYSNKFAEMVKDFYLKL